MILESTFEYRGLGLLDVLPDAEFVERHAIDVAAPRAVVWEALHEVRWSDLRATAPLMLARGLGISRRRLLENGPVRLMGEAEPSYVVAGKVARPWQLRPLSREEVRTLEQLRDFAEPGWLKYGMDFRLDEISPGRTRVTTWTRCQATDDRARRRFRRYWRMIRPFSGLIRRDLLHALRRRALAAAG